MALSFTTLSEIYNTSEGGFFVHSLCYGVGDYSSYIFALLCEQEGTGDIFIAQFNASTLALVATKKLARSIGTAGAQYIYADANYLYISVKTTVETVSGIEIFRIACANFSSSTSYACYRQNITESDNVINVGVQDFAIGNDKNSTSCIFCAEGQGSSTAMRVLKLTNNWDSLPANMMAQYNSANQWIWRGPTYTYITKNKLSGDYLYCAGFRIKDSHVQAMVMRIKQELNGSFSDLTDWSQALVCPSNSCADAWDAGVFDFIFDSADANSIWAVGFLRQQNTTAEGGAYNNSYCEGVLLKIAINGTNLSTTAVYRVRKTDNSLFKLGSIWQDTNNLYISSTSIPHAIIGGDTDSTSPQQIVVLKVAKSAPATITWSRHIADPGGSSYKTQACNSSLGISSDDFIGGGWTNIGTGYSSKLGALLFRMDIASNSNASPLYDSNTTFKELSITTVTITDVTSDTHWTKSTDSGTLTKDPDNEAASTDTAWTASASTFSNTIKTLETTSPAIILTPASDKTDNLTCIGAHYTACSDASDSTYVSNITATSWIYDLFGHDKVSTLSDPGGRPTKVEIIGRFFQGQTGSNNRIAVEYRFGDSGTLGSKTPSTTATTSAQQVTVDVTSELKTLKGYSSGQFLTWTDLRDLQFGPSLYASFLNNTACTKIWVKITWEPYNVATITGNGGTIIGGTATWKKTVYGAALEGVSLAELAGRSLIFDCSAQDGVGASDTSARQASLTSLISDVIQKLDASSSQAALVATASDSAQIQDTPSATASYAIAVIDAIAVAGTLQTQGAFGATASDTIQTGESLNRGIVIDGNAADSAAVSDAPGRVAILEEAATDTAQVADTSGRAATLNATATDSAQVADTGQTQANMGGTASDTLQATDAAQRAVIIPLTATDAAGLADTTSSLREGNTSVIDGLILGDSVTAIAALVAALSDALAFSESFPGGNIYSDSLSDSVGISDLASRLAAIAGIAVDQIQAVDIPTSLGVFGAQIAEALQMGDATGLGSIFNDAIADGLSMADLVSGIMTLLGYATDQVRASDSTSPQNEIGRISADTLAVTSTAGAVATFQATATDGLSFSESLLAAAILFALCADAAGVTENASGEVSGSTIKDESISDGMALADSASRALTVLAELLEGTSLGDSAVSSAVAVAVILDVLQLVDSNATGNLFDVLINDGTAYQETLAGALERAATALEGITLSDTSQVIAAFASRITDGMTLGEAVGHTADFLATVNDACNLGDVAITFDLLNGEALVTLKSTKLNFSFKLEWEAFKARSIARGARYANWEQAWTTRYVNYAKFNIKT